jgi:hypothetical protein
LYTSGAVSFPFYKTNVDGEIWDMG